MLREGWDVRNVTVIVGLRPYSSKANILPEQTIGRGLRLMFRDMAGEYTERVDIIGNRAFIDFVEDLEKAEDLKFDKFEVGKDRLKIITVMPLESKLMYDIGIPRISAWLARKKSIAKEIAEIDVMKLDSTTIPLREGAEIAAEMFKYFGHDILTDEEILYREYFKPNPQTPEEIIGFFARAICASLKLPAHFADLAPKIREFFERKLFGTEVDLNDPKVMKAMDGNVVKYHVPIVFKAALKDKITEEKTPELIVAEDLLSRTAPFPTAKKILEARKTVFNYTPCDNEYEYAFAKFLDKADDVASFAKLPEQFGFCIQYTDVNANIRNYFPDFIARNADDENWIIETKGREDTDVVRKDAAAERWCAAASEYTHKTWRYMKVMQNVFEELRPETFFELKLVVDKN
jgi:type III restriction enzyme